MKPLLKNGVFCVLPWIHQMVDTTGSVRLCCHQPRNNNLGHSSDTEGAWNGEMMRQIRRDMILGKPIDACSRCYGFEQIGQPSSRISTMEQYGDSEQFREAFRQSLENDMVVENSPIYLDIRFGNLCNLVCKMCGPWSSSQIIKDQIRLKKADPDNFNKYHDHDPETDLPTFDWYENDQFWEVMDKYLPGIVELYLTGGEPTLIDKNTEFMKRCVDLGYAKSIHLRFSTNLTNISQHFIDLCKHFGSVHFACSIDGSGLVDEYIRYPSRWSKIKENLIKLCDAAKEPGVNFIIRIHTVVQAYNIMSLPEIFNDFIEIDRKHGSLHGNPITINTRPLIQPPRFAINNLPEPIKSTARDTLRTWIEQNSDARVHFTNWNSFDSIFSMLDSKPTVQITAKSQLDYARYHDQNKPISIETHLPVLHRFLVEYAGWEDEH